jgi:hypothetical protein
MKIKKSFLFLNAILIIAIVTVLFLTFYKKEVAFDCNFDAKPGRLLDLISRSFPGISLKDVSVVFVFNSLPSKSDIQTIEKLHYKYNEEVSVLTLFTRKFKNNQPIRFPYKFLSHSKITCTRGKGGKGKEFAVGNYFVLLNNGKIQHVDTKLDLVDMAFLVRKKLDPQLGYSDFALSSGDLRNRIVQRLNKGSLHLLRVDTGNEDFLRDLTGISRVYFIHASCSTCQLKSLFNNLKLKQILDDSEKAMIIFSIFADSISLNEILGESDLKMPVYVDSSDEFDLFSTITNDRENPIIIDLTDKDKESR